MICGRRRLILVALLALFGILLPFVGNFSRQRLGEGSAGEGPGTATGGGDGQEDVQISVKEEEKEVKAEDAGERQETDPIEEIKPIHIPFKQKPGEWEKKGISFSASGEPKSGTTWLGRVVVELSLKLCGNPRNSWCKMGGLTVIDKPPAPRYDFEMLNADTGWLYLHFKGIEKHQIPGFGAKGGCSGGSIVHGNTFGRPFPCDGMEKPTRAALEACLPDKSPKCVPFLPPLDPARRRAAVVIRDPRNVVISEHRMRSTVYHENVGPLQPFVRYRLERILAWVNQRWVWHTTGLKDISHVMFYEDLKADPVHLIELASFMGLECTAEEANSIWRVDTNANPPGDWTTYGLSHETLEWMNTTMASLLPEAVLDRYGLTPIYD